MADDSLEMPADARHCDPGRRELLCGLAALLPSAALAAPLHGEAGPGEPQYPCRLLADGLRFPEGPVALSDGSVLLVEIARGTLTRVTPDGKVEVVARLGGGPNGAAIGPDGACYVCNNGGDRFEEVDGMLLPVGPSGDYAGGWIERVDLGSGKREILYREIGDQALSAPNDLVFDDAGGFWFSDIGKSRSRSRDHGAIGYAQADGSGIECVVYPATTPNGVGLSPDGGTLLVAELLSGRLLAFGIEGPGRLTATSGVFPGRLVASGPGRCLFDSLAVEADGTIAVAAPLPGNVLRFSANGRLIDSVPMPGTLPTNICFGGPHRKTAFITLAGTGQLIAMEWPKSGRAPAYSA